MKTVIRSEEWDIHYRLSDFDLSPDLLIEVVRAVVAHYGSCTDNDPPTARGWESWRWGVRRPRELLRPQGWDKDDAGGFSTVVNHKRRFRMAFVRTDDATGVLGEHNPQNRSPKGPLSERATTANQLSFPESRVWPRPERLIDEYETWHLCVYLEDDIVEQSYRDSMDLRPVSSPIVTNA